MADHSSNQRADSAVFSEDDPFAELTRIMGHDPRRAEASGNEAEQEGDDLALELENELLGDLAEFSDEVHEEAVPQDDWQPQPSGDWRFDAVEAEQRPDEPAVDIAADMADELDESFAASFESEMRLEPADDFPAVSTLPEEEAEVSEPVEGVEAELVEQHFSEFDVDMAEPSGPFSEPDYERDEPIESPAQKDALEFSDQDFAQLDNDLEASLANEDWFGSENDVGEQSLETTDAATSAADPFNDLVTEEALEAAEPAVALDPYSAEPDYPAERDVFEEFEQSEVSLSLDQAEDTAASADPFLSPQAFASSIAQGAERASAVDGDVAREDHDFTATLEDHLSASPSEEPAPVEPLVQPQAEDGLQAEASWEGFETVDTEPELPAEDDPVEATLAAPFWQQPEHPSDALSSEHQSSVPHIDTVDVPGNERVQVEDSAHIPEFISEPERVPETESDDLELALARAFGDSESLPGTVAAAEVGYEAGTAVPNDAYAAAALQPTEQAREEEDFGFETAFADSFSEPDNFAGPSEERAVDKREADPADAFVVSDMDSWSDPSEEFERGPGSFASETAGAVAGRSGPLSNRRNLAMFGVAGGVAILALVGFFAFSGGGEDNSAPVVVRADDEPIKVKPENPGGEQVPNQDNQVYQRVSGAEAGTDPVQERLVSTAEEPVDVPQAAPKSEERLSSNADDTVTPTSEPVTAMTPRRVRTMVVRPDGTIVPREPEAPAQNTENAVATGNVGSPEQQVEATTAQQASQEAAPDARLASADPLNGSAEDANASAGNVPVTAPVPPSRPAAPPSQPQRTVETTPPAQVAAAPSQPAQPVAQTLAPAPVTSGSDGWSVQISSQPTVEAAQKSYQDMAQRYGGLLTGKGVNIVKADIAGKGTYYRVRIPSSSKDEAIRLCSQLKSSGGSCFVSK